MEGNEPFFICECGCTRKGVVSAYTDSAVQGQREESFVILHILNLHKECEVMSLNSKKPENPKNTS